MFLARGAVKDDKKYEPATWSRLDFARCSKI